MNLYFVYADELHYTEEIDPEIGGPHYDDGVIAEYVYAETPSKAKALVFQQERRRWSHLEYIWLTVTLQRRDVDAEAGIVSVYEDRLAAICAGIPEEYLPGGGL